MRSVTSVRTVRTNRSAKHRPRTARRDLHHLDTHVRQDRIERRRELPGPIADEEPEPRDVSAEIHHEVPGL